MSIRPTGAGFTLVSRPTGQKSANGPDRTQPNRTGPAGCRYRLQRWCTVSVRKLIYWHCFHWNWCSLVPLRYWLWRHWLHRDTDTVHTGQTGPLTLSLLLSLIYWHRSRWSHWYTDTDCPGFTGTLTLISPTTPIHWDWLHWIHWHTEFHEMHRWALFLSSGKYVTTTKFPQQLLGIRNLVSLVFNWFYIQRPCQRSDLLSGGIFRYESMYSYGLFSSLCSRSCSSTCVAFVGENLLQGESELRISRQLIHPNDVNWLETDKLIHRRAFIEIHGHRCKQQVSDHLSVQSLCLSVCFLISRQYLPMGIFRARNHARRQFFWKKTRTSQENS